MPDCEISAAILLICFLCNNNFRLRVGSTFQILPVNGEIWTLLSHTPFTRANPSRILILARLIDLISVPVKTMPGFKVSMIS